jgi:uncharacterized Ntn-hydrolase superfamily protein
VTFSIAARCAKTHMFGIAIASSSPAVAARCAHARAGVGAVASQNITDPALGPRILDFMAQSQPAPLALQNALRSTPFGEFRQLLVVGGQGPPAIHSGRRALGVVGAVMGQDCAAAGNLLARIDVPEAMVEAFEASVGHFGARLLRGLRAGMQHGGEAGPVRSAGLLVVRDVSWPIVDLRVDWSEQDPLAELAAIWDIFEPQIEDYVRRAVNPGDAPRFGVPGDP